MSRRSRHGVRGLFVLLAGALGCELPPELEQSQASLVTAETNAIHMLGDDRGGRLLHTVRSANGIWERLGDVATQAGEIGFISGSTAAYSDGLLYVGARTGTNFGFFHWFLTSRADSGWTQFQALPNSSQIADLGLARDSSGRIHLCGQGNSLVHGIYTTSNGFGGFNELPIARPAGGLAAVDCAAIGGDLYYAVATHRNTASGPIDVFIAVRRADGSWSGFQLTNSLPSGEGHTESISLDSSGDTLHLVVTATQTQFHAMKVGGGAWSGLGNVESVAGDPKNSLEWRVDSGAIAAVGGELHLIQSTKGDNFGGLWHTIRFANGGWAQFQDVEQAVPRGTPVVGLHDVSLSRSRNN